MAAECRSSTRSTASRRFFSRCQRSATCPACGGAFRRRLGVGRRTVPADHLDPGMGLEPRRHGVRVAVGEQVDDVTAFQVHDDGAVTLPLAPRPVIDPHDPRGPCRLVLEPLDPPQQCIGAGGHRHACGEAGAGLTAQGRADVRLGLPEPVGGPCPRCGEPREALGEDASWAVGLWAHEAADGDLKPHAPAETGQVVEPAGVPAVHAAGVGAAEGAGRRGGGDRQVDGEASRHRDRHGRGSSLRERPATRAEAPRGSGDVVRDGLRW